MTKLFLKWWEIVIVMINWLQDIGSSNSACNHTLDQQIGLPLRGRPILLITRMITERNWTPLSPITIINDDGRR